jgi:sporulation protein YlmC with PRC-barrel domain
MKKIAILSFALMLGASPLALAQTSSTGTEQNTTAPAPEMNKSADPNAPATQSTEQTPTAPSADQKATETAPSTDQKATETAPSTDQKATETAPSTEQKSTTDTTTTAPSTSQTTATANMPAGEEHLASEIIGATVYSPSGDNVGDINDLVVGADGKISMAVIGVGGFLGMGEKDVGIEMSRLRFEKAPAPSATDTSSTTTTTTATTPPAASEADNWRIVLDTTAEELKSMPDFDRSKY